MGDYPKKEFPVLSHRLEIPERDSLRKDIEAGKNAFKADLRTLGIDPEVNISAVHTAEDADAQAYILAIPSKGRPEEIKTKSYLTHAVHWVDDFFDSPDRQILTPEIINNRKNITSVLKLMGSVGEIALGLAEKTPNPQAVLRGLHRVFYGGLVQNEPDLEKRAQLLKEYKSISLDNLEPELASEVLALQPSAYWTTNKVVLELLNAAEPKLDISLSEAWNLVYAAAIFYHDLDEEKIRGEYSFTKDEPKKEEMTKMIQLGGKYIKRYPDERKYLRIEQLKTLINSFQKVLPEYVMTEYAKLLGELENQAE